MEEKKTNHQRLSTTYFNQDGLKYRSSVDMNLDELQKSSATSTYMPPEHIDKMIEWLDKRQNNEPDTKQKIKDAGKKLVKVLKIKNVIEKIKHSPFT